MKKYGRIILAVILCAALCGCDVQTSYEEMLHRLEIPSFAQENENSNKLDEPKQPAVISPAVQQVSRSWPQEVPAPESVLECLQEGATGQGGFSGEYRISPEQLAGWEEALLKDGFDKTADGFADGAWTVEMERLEETATDYRLRVTIVPTAQSWDPAFSMFPIYNGDGAYTVEVDMEADSGPVMQLVATGETQQGYQRYLDTLSDDGFILIDYVIYHKLTADGMYEINTDGAWTGDGTVRLTYYIYVK